MERPSLSQSPGSMPSNESFASYRIGVDLGGTKIESILLDPHGDEVHRLRSPSSARDGYRAVLLSLRDHIQSASAEIPPGFRSTVGIGIPGSINDRTGLVQNANSTCLIGNPLQRDVTEMLKRSVAVDNDANCFALAESRSGAGVGYDMVFGIIMGTGCGGGLCIGGNVRQGLHRIAGEWGHVSVDPGGADCYCGNRGCIETKISGSGVERSFLARYGESLTMEEIVRGHREGEPRCSRVFGTFLDDFGRCIGGLISVLDPDAVVLGGGLSNIDELYAEGLERMRGYVFHGDIRTPVLKNRLGDSAGVFGAAWIGI